MNRVNSVVGPIAGVLLSGCASLANQGDFGNADSYRGQVIDMRNQIIPDDFADQYPAEQFTPEVCARVAQNRDNMLDIINPYSVNYNELIALATTDVFFEWSEDILARCAEINGADVITDYK